MIVSSDHLFFALLKKFQVSLVFDIGSRDGRQSLQIRKCLPNSKIIAFEANPDNYNYMNDSAELKDNNIDVFNIAVSNFNGISNFNIYGTDNYSCKKELTGLSSLYERKDLKLSRKISVDTVRLDDFVYNNKLENNDIALWVDVEGADYQVIEGIEKIHKQVCLIHVEVLNEKIYEGPQKTKKEIIDKMDELGFKKIGADFKDKKDKFSFGNIVFINKQYLQAGINLNALIIRNIILKHVRQIIAIINKNRSNKFYTYAKDIYYRRILK